MATFAQTVQAYGQKSFERMANDLARYANLSDAQRLAALDRAKANARKPADGPDFGISSESVSRESAGAMSGSLIDANGAIVGTVQLTASKVKQVSGEAVCDVTVQTIDLNGKRTVSKVKGVSASEATLAGLGLNAVLPGAVGGDLKVGGAYCCVDFSEGFGQLDVVTGLLPLAEPIRCDTKGKWKLDKAAKVKLAKGKDGTYALSVDRQKGKTNVSGLKLTYKPKTGVFTGSFKLYALGGTSDRPKLVTRQVKVSGLVVDGIGNGTATVAGTDLAWPVLIITE